MAIKTIGCRLNQADSQELSVAMSRAGWRVVSDKRRADLLIVNSCAVTHTATRKSRQALRGYHHRFPRTKIVALGCSEPELQSLPEVDVAIPLKYKTRAVEIIERECKIIRPGRTRLGRENEKCKIGQPGAEDFSRTRGLVKIQDGCDEFCTYCIVPFRRGKPRCVSVPGILAKIKQREAAGAKEIVLTGVHLGRYRCRGLALAGLVRKILAQSALPRIRFSSIEPQHFTAAILKLFHSSRICPFLHLPIQSGSDRILRVMHRRYTTRWLAGLIRRIHKAVPGIFLSTDVIVGFPGETEADFARTMEFCRRTGFAKIHVFSYSKREGTLASRYPGQLEPATIARRSQRLRRLSDQLNLKYRRRLAGKRLEVLLETARTGTSREGVKVSFHRWLCPNTLVRAKINKITADRTFAKLI